MIDKDELIKCIRSAFEGVELEGGISLNMTEYYDSGGCAPEYKTLAKTDEKKNWANISRETLEKFSVTFSFTDIAGYKFYAPAYMISCLNNYKHSDSIIDDAVIYAMDPESYQFEKISFTEAFSPEQLQTIINFLKFVIENSDCLDVVVAKENLQKIERELHENS